MPSGAGVYHSSGAFNAYVNLFYYALIIMQERKRIFLGYVGVTAAALLISSPCVRAAGLLGGSLSYLLLMAALTACFGLDRKSTRLNSSHRN